jgi:RNA-binding protein
MKGSTRKYLRSLAHHLEPVVIIGKRGLTDSVIQKIDDALVSHELIKIKFLEFRDQKKAFSGEIIKQTQSEIVGRIGHIIMLYREHPDAEKRKIILPE